MKALPHSYVVSAEVGPERNVQLKSPSLEMIESAGPAEFGGPGDRWSPETLLVAAVADCFVLSFRAVARAARFEWIRLGCRVDAELDRIDGVTRFTRMLAKAELEIADAAQVSKARRLLEKAEKSCLITNSLNARVSLEADVRIVT